MTRSRNKALLSMTSPLGTDVLVPTALAAEECISEPYRCVVDLVSERRDIDSAALLGKPACIILRHADKVTRYFHGIIAEFAPEGGADRTFSTYRAVLVPRLWLMSQTVDCRVYQQKSVMDILKVMFADAGVTGTDFRIFGAKPVREYTVQFNESDLCFATRLMEEEGWFYFFEHSADAHRLVVTDANTGFTTIPDTTLRFDSVAGGADVLTQWRRPHATTHGQVALRDYDPSAPDKQLRAQQNTVLNHSGAATRDVFLWPALTTDTGQVTTRTRLRMEAAEAAVSLAETTGASGILFAGGRFTLAKDPGTGASDVPYVVRRIHHDARDESWVTGEGTPSYANAFSAFLGSVPWRQPIATPRPRMEGLHAAVVLGPDSDDIYTDDQGRVKVRFFWDHRSEATHDLSCWARVIQPWAGPGWGAQFIPRVGTEVAVAFMDADPDRPVVVGGFYNGRDKPIFPANEKTKSGIRTRSSIKGGVEQFSELSFDDKKDSEKVLLHAQKDLETTVENNQALTVMCDRTVGVRGKETLTIKMDRTHEVTEGNDSLTVKQGNLSTVVEMGDVTLKADLGSVTVEAMQSITLKVGESSVTVNQQGVTIKGMTLSIEGMLSTEVKGAMTQVNGSAMLTLKGGIMMIN